MTRVKPAILQAARGLGVEPQLRCLQRVLEPRHLRRNRRDDENLRVLMAATLARDSNCVDVGANVGSVLRDIVGYAPLGHHVAYEPLPDLAADLERAFPQVDVRNAALSDHRGELVFVRDTRAPSRSGFRATGGPGRTTKSLRVPVEDLDSSLPAGYVPRLIKIDVEGAEVQVLEGAIEVIATHKPLVVFEHGRAAASYGTRPADVFELLCRRAGLDIFDMDGAGPYELGAFEQVATSGGRDHRWNFFACA